MFSEYFQRLVRHRDPLLQDVFNIHFRGPYYFCTYTLERTEGRGKAEYILRKIKKILHNCK